MCVIVATLKSDQGAWGRGRGETRLPHPRDTAGLLWCGGGLTAPELEQTSKGGRTMNRLERAQEELRAARRDGQKTDAAKDAGRVAAKDPGATGAVGSTRGSRDWRSKHARDMWSRKQPRYLAAMRELRAITRDKGGSDDRQQDET